MRWLLRRSEIVGSLLLLLSAYPLLLMGAELVTEQRAYKTYALRRIPANVPGAFDDALTAEIGAHRVELRDSLEGYAANVDDRSMGRVSILIDARDLSHTSDVVILPYFKDQNRYHSWVKLIRLVDKVTGTERLAIIQRISPGQVDDRADWDVPRNLLQYRILLVDAYGHVSDEVFSFRDRAHPLYRAMLAKYVSPYDIGFRSDVLQAWPTIAFPVVYPWATAIVGLLLVLVGAALRFRRIGQFATPRV